MSESKKKIVAMRLPSKLLREFRKAHTDYNFSQNRQNRVSMSNLAIALAQIACDSISDERMLAFKEWTKTQDMNLRESITFSVPQEIHDDLTECAKAINVRMLSYYWIGLIYFKKQLADNNQEVIEDIYKQARELKNV